MGINETAGLKFENAEGNPPISVPRDMIREGAPLIDCNYTHLFPVKSRQTERHLETGSPGSLCTLIRPHTGVWRDVGSDIGYHKTFPFRPWNILNTRKSLYLLQGIIKGNEYLFL